MSVAPVANTQCASNETGPTPAFPSLYIPQGLERDGIYLCSTRDAWLFTLLWTLIIYAGFYIAAAGYAAAVQVVAHFTTGNASAKGRGRRIDGRVAAVVAVGNSSSGSNKDGGGGAGAGAGAAKVDRVQSLAAREEEEERRSARGLLSGARRNWKVTLLVGTVYVLIGGIEAVAAGSVVGVILGTVYQAGGFRLSTWIPLVWSVINVLFLILSSFSIQERLL